MYSAHSSEPLPSGHGRIALQVAYNGRNYHGWQCQVGVTSVQQRLEQALSKVANTPIQLICAGRTDTGVHASAQIVHFDTPNQRPLRAWTHGTNANLPDDIAVQWAHPVKQTFHARFSALSRRYMYIIYNHAMRPGLMDKEVTWNFRPLDVSAMQAAAKYLEGEHDFTSFRAGQCQANSPIRTVHHLKVIQQGAYVVLDVHANAFLHHMIRNFAGTLMHIGSGQEGAIWAKQVLAAQDRRCAAVTASPCGLYFAGASYPEAYRLPVEICLPHFLQGWMNVL